jgi:iron complex transport system substrate-binding protein
MNPALRIVALGLAAAALLGPPTVAAEPLRPKPQRILSMNLCTDLLLLQLAPKARIASVSYLAHDGVMALFPGADAGLAINHGTAEDVLNQKPDLILAGEYSTPVATAMARRVGARVVQVHESTNFAEIRQAVRQVGDAVGEPERAAALIARMDAILADLAAHPPKRPLRVVAWSGGSSVPGRDSLTNAIVEAAGAVNIAALPGRRYTTFGAEELLAADPDALLFEGVTAGHPSLRSDEGQHPVVRKVYGARRISYNQAAHGCGLPQSAEAARDLRRALDALPERRPAR